MPFLFLLSLKCRLLGYKKARIYWFISQRHYSSNPLSLWIRLEINICCFVVLFLSHAQLFCNPMSCSLTVSFIHGIFQARILELIALYFCKGSFQPRDWTPVSCIDRWVLYHWTTREAQIFINTTCLKMIWSVWSNKYYACLTSSGLMRS